MSSPPASTATPAPSAQHSRRRFARISSHPLKALKALKAKFQSISFRRSPSPIGVGSPGVRSLAVEPTSREPDSGSPTAPSPHPVQPDLSLSPPSYDPASSSSSSLSSVQVPPRATTPSSETVQSDLSPFHAPPALAQPSPPAPSSSSALSSQQAPSRANSPTPTGSRTIKHWPWRPNVYARLKIQGHILPVKLAQVASAPPRDFPRASGGNDWYKAHFWACVYIEELDYCWWAFTTAIILLDEILRHPLHENVLAPATAEIKSLVNDLRTLRDAVTSDENYGGSRLWLPLSSGETLDEAMSTTHVCRPHGDTFHEILHYSRNPGFFDNGLGMLIFRACRMCRDLHTSSELLYFGDLPQEALSRVEAFIRSGRQNFKTELQGMRFFAGIMQLVMTQQGQRQYESATLDRALETVPVPEIVGAGAYGRIFKVTHPYWGDLAVKEPLSRQVPEQNERNELGSHFGIPGHSNILPVVAWTLHESRIVVAMQWAENGSLDKFLARNPDSSRILPLVNVATALRQLHEFDRIHGDLHMGNIVVSKDDEAFLCDFGLSKEVDDDNALDDAAGGTVYGGVPIYTAPELYEPGARRTFASEVFAFGMVIFHAYSGTRPFVLMANNEVAQHEAAIITAIVNGTRPTRDQVTRDDFSDEMWNLVQDCWNQDPAHRPSMSQVVTRMTDMVPLKDMIKFLVRAHPIELTFFRPGDVALEDAMQTHEQSAQLRWTLSRMEHFGLKAFFIRHADERDAIVMGTARAMLSGEGAVMDMGEMMNDPNDFRVLLRLAGHENDFPDSDSSN